MWHISLNGIISNHNLNNYLWNIYYCFAFLLSAVVRDHTTGLLIQTNFLQAKHF